MTKLKKTIHYAIPIRFGIWKAACGAYTYFVSDLDVKKSKVDCKRCQKTIAFKKGKSHGKEEES